MPVGSVTLSCPQQFCVIKFELLRREDLHICMDFAGGLGRPLKQLNVFYEVDGWARIDRAPGAVLAAGLRQQGSFLGVTMQES